MRKEKDERMLNKGQAKKCQDALNDATRDLDALIKYVRSEADDACKRGDNENSAKLREVVGEAPFTVLRGSRRREAPTYDTLRGAIMDLAREGISLSRFKGLGEMNAEQLWETTMDPERRTLKQVRLEDAVAADEMFTVLMGDDVAARRTFIQANARNATIDV
jgi:DNA gyrase/topoisomerase IV subunit B